MFRFLAIGLLLLLASCQSVLVHETRSSFSHIQIRDHDSRRTLYFVADDGTTTLETVIDLRQPQRLLHPYSHTMTAVFLYRPDPTTGLLVGLGGGALVRFLNHEFPEMRLDVVEIDPVVVDLARRFFGTAPGPRTRIFVEDAFEHVPRTSERYDVILVNAHLKPGEQTDVRGMPLHLKTVGFLSHLRERVRPGGAVAFNIIEGPDTGADVQNIRSVFGNVEVFRSASAGNVIVIAMPSGAIPSESELRARARTLDRRGERGFSFERVLGERGR